MFEFKNQLSILKNNIISDVVLPIANKITESAKEIDKRNQMITEKKYGYELSERNYDLSQYLTTINRVKTNSFQNNHLFLTSNHPYSCAGLFDTSIEERITDGGKIIVFSHANSLNMGGFFKKDTELSKRLTPIHFPLRSLKRFTLIADEYNQLGRFNLFAKSSKLTIAEQREYYNTLFDFLFKTLNVKEHFCNSIEEYIQKNNWVISEKDVEMIKAGVFQHNINPLMKHIFSNDQKEAIKLWSDLTLKTLLTEKPYEFTPIYDEEMTKIANLFNGNENYSEITEKVTWLLETIGFECDNSLKLEIINFFNETAHYLFNSVAETHFSNENGVLQTYKTYSLENLISSIDDCEERKAKFFNIMPETVINDFGIDLIGNLNGFITHSLLLKTLSKLTSFEEYKEYLFFDRSTFDDSSYIGNRFDLSIITLNSALQSKIKAENYIKFNPELDYNSRAKYGQQYFIDIVSVKSFTLTMSDMLEMGALNKNFLTNPIQLISFAKILTLAEYHISHEKLIKERKYQETCINIANAIFNLVRNKTQDFAETTNNNWLKTMSPIVFSFRWKNHSMLNSQNLFKLKIGTFWPNDKVYKIQSGLNSLSDEEKAIYEHASIFDKVKTVLLNK